MELQIKPICRKKGIAMKTLAGKLGITRQALDKRILNNPKWSSLNEIAEAINVDVMELIKPNEGFVHFYNGEQWMGICRKD